MTEKKDAIVVATATDLTPFEADRYIPPEQAARLEETLRHSLAPKTRAAYSRAWRLYASWCEKEGRSPIPATPETVAVFLSENKHLGLPTLRHVLAVVTQYHGLKGIDPPPTHYQKVKTTWKAIQREVGRASPHAKAPVTFDELSKMLDQIDLDDLKGIRDRAMLLVGFATACRESEIVAIQRSHVVAVPGGIAITIARSKTDQEGRGEVVGIARQSRHCPVQALEAWLDASCIESGPVFRGFDQRGRMRDRAAPAQEVARVVKVYAGLAGLDPTKYAGHSLRAGFVTQAVRDDVSDTKIMATTRHKSTSMLVRYRREADPVKRGASASLQWFGDKKGKGAG